MNRPADDPQISLGRIKLDRACILLIDNAWGVEILARIFKSFGASRVHRAQSIAEAETYLADHQVDLIVAEALIDGQDIFPFIRGLRANAQAQHNRFAPVILLSAHSATEKVAQARDCGINFFVAKPISPKVIMKRVLWVAKNTRPCLETPSYAGPDRRFRDVSPPPGVTERRQGKAYRIEKSA
jgi:DNA-binding response OmpR family regulator